MNTRTPRWVAPAIWIACAAVAHADDVSLVGDFRLNTPAFDGTVQIGADLQARFLSDGDTHTSPVSVDGATATLSAPSGAALRIRARRDGGFDVVGGGRLTRQDTFPAAAIERTRTFLKANASGYGGMDCITTVNHAVRLLNSDRSIRVGSQQDLTMNGLVSQGLAERPIVIEFNNDKGKRTTGVTEPAKLRQSVFQTLRTTAKGDRGWSVYGLSIMDGYHSVLLFFDGTDPAKPRVYWADQWSSNGGFKEFTGDGLDENIEAKTRSWWSSSKKPRTRTTLWRLKPQAQGKVQVGTVRASRLNVRAGPGSDEDKVDSLRRQVRVQITDKDGLWRQVVTPTGELGWAHSTYLATSIGVPSGLGLPVSASGITTALGQ